MSKRTENKTSDTSSSVTKKAKVSPDDGIDNRHHKTSLAARLVDEWHFSNTELARKFANNGIAEALFALENDNFMISEDDPLLIISVDVEDPNSVNYFRHGNYGVGLALPAPLPPKYIAPPHALGSFIGGLPGVQEKGGGSYTLFLVDRLESLHRIPPILNANEQFRRNGPLVSALIGGGVAVEQPLVEFYTLTAMRSQPGAYPHFNQTV